MFEIKRVLLNRKLIMLIFILVLFNSVLFGLDCSVNKEITLTGDELSEYTNVTYNEFLSKTAEQAKTLSNLMISGDGGDFVKKNINKSAADYTKLTDVMPVYGENRGITAFSNFHLTDIIFIGILLLIVFGFGEENTKGLTFLVRSTAGGRTKLCAYRIATLFIGSLTICILLYGGNIIMLTANFGAFSPERAIQSVPEFMRCSYAISIWQYLLYSVLIKCFTGIIAAMFLFAVISVFGTVVTAAVCTACTVAAFMFYALILPTSYLNILKFTNPFSLLTTDVFFKEYCNYNIFGSPVNMLFFSLVTYAVLFVVLLIAAIIINSGKISVSRIGFFTPAIEKVFRFTSIKAPQLPLFFWEGKKVLINQKGVLFSAVCFYLALSSALEYRYMYPVDTYELMWHAEYDGIITNELIIQMHEKVEAITEIIKAKWNNYYSPNTPPQRKVELIDEIADYEHRKASLEVVTLQAENGYEYSKESGREIWLIKPYSYKLLLVDDVKTTQKHTLYILLGVIGTLAGIIAVENSSGTKLTLRTSVRGRGMVIVSKVIWVFVISTVLSVAIHLIQYFQINAAIEYTSTDALVQSLDFMRSFPFYVPIKIYFIMLFAFRAFTAALCGVFTGFISALRKDRISVMGICVFCLAVPYILIFS